MLSSIFLLFGCVAAMPVHQNSYYKSIWQPETAGDIILTSEQRFIKALPDSLRFKFFQTNNEYRRWPGNVVPYVLSDRQTTEQRRKIRKSMDLIQRVSCFRFVERTTQKDYLYFNPGTGCQAALGRVGGAQEISLPEFCIENGVEIHEMFHALGVNHEHQRPDRDEYINVEMANVLPGWEWVYDKIQESVDASRFPYDYHSIMHYYSVSYGRKDEYRNTKTVMTYKNGQPVPTNVVMSDEDIRKLNELGKCSQRNPNKRRPNKSRGNTWRG